MHFQSFKASMVCLEGVLVGYMENLEILNLSMKYMFRVQSKGFISVCLIRNCQ